MGFRLLLFAFLYILSITFGGYTSYTSPQEDITTSQDTLYIKYSPHVYSKPKQQYFPQYGYEHLESSRVFWFYPGKVHSKPGYFVFRYIKTPKEIGLGELRHIQTTDFNQFIKEKGWSSGHAELNFDVYRQQEKYKIFIIKKSKGKIWLYEIRYWQYHYMKEV